MPTHTRSHIAARRTTALLVAFAATALFALAFAACGGGGGDDAPRDQESEPEAQVIDIVSKEIAFDKAEIRVAGGEEITVRHDNQDEAMPHNFAIYESSEAKDLVAATEIEVGLVQQELIVEALEPGDYFFRCDTHPTQMIGTLIVG
jgi:plastocyanin